VHQGEDFLYMVEGTSEVWLDEVECHLLQQGDSFWFESNRGHCRFDPTNKQAAVLWVNTPPTFLSASPPGNLETEPQGL
jgi:quercetin dioxygenase-like cupin family protein